MKFIHMISLLQSDYYTIKAIFPKCSTPYTFKVKKGIDLSVGDHVIVDSSRTGFTVVEVHAIDETPDINLDADFPYSWIVQKVDPSDYYHRRETERRVYGQLLELEKRKQQS